MAIEIHHPHDSFFKKSLSSLAVAKDFLKAHLSPEIIQRIDWSTLRSTNKSYVKAHLAQLHSDVVYSCQVEGKQAYLYTLIEHQSTADPMLPFRMLQYNVSLMEEHLAQGHKQLPIVINLCLYSGKKTPYPDATDIYDCFEDPVLARAAMFKPLELIDLNTYAEEELAQHGQADLVQILLKHSQKRAFLAWIKANPALVQRLFERLYGISGVVYILGVEEKNSFEEIINAIVEVAPNRKEDIMTAAQQLQKEGLQQGMQQEKLSIAKQMLAKGLDRQLIGEMTGLSEEKIKQLTKWKQGQPLW